MPLHKGTKVQMNVPHRLAHTDVTKCSEQESNTHPTNPMQSPKRRSPSKDWNNLKTPKLDATHINRRKEKRSLVMLDRLLGQQLLHGFPRLEELKRRLDEPVEEERKVHQQGKAEHLQPPEPLPAEAERHDPDEERPARVDGRPRRGAHAPGDGESKEVEATREPSQRTISRRTTNNTGGNKLTRC